MPVQTNLIFVSDIEVRVFSSLYPRKLIDCGKVFPRNKHSSLFVLRVSTKGNKFIVRSTLGSNFSSCYPLKEDEKERVTLSLLRML